MRLADVQFRTQERAVLATVTGEIDLSNAEEVGAALVDAIGNDTHALVLDLSEVQHLDSAGIQLIYRLRENLRARGRQLRLVIPHCSVAHDALRLAGISRNVRTLESIDDAFTSLT